MIADSSAWIAFFRSTGSPVDLRLSLAIRNGEPLHMPDAVYQEVLQGARNSAHFDPLREQLEQVERFVPLDLRQCTENAAHLYARCRWRGVTIRSANDCLIAMCAIEAGVPLLHDDRDFEAIARIEPRLQLM